MASEWLLWQLVDSAFPAGGFAHSGGLEAAYQHGRVMGRASLEAFLAGQLRQAARGMVPFALAARREPERFAELDALCDAFLSNHVANRASRAQGQAYLSATQRVFGGSILAAMREQLRVGACPAHFPPVFGVVAETLQIDLTQTARLHLFISLRGWVSSAVRLGIVGPLEGQAIQNALAPLAEQCAQRSLNIVVDDIAQTAPLQDLLQATHDRLYSRLFQT